MRKYIIGYNDDTISPLQLFLPKVTGYLNIFKDGARKIYGNMGKNKRFS